MDFKHPLDLTDHDEGSAESLLRGEQSSPTESRRNHTLTLKALTVHFIFFSIYTLLFALLWIYNRSVNPHPRCGVDHLSPAAEAIRFERVTSDIDAPNIYRGNPSPELDSAWEELLKGYNLRISRHTLQAMGRKSIQLADGSGDYWGILDSFHNIHCLKMIRHHLAPDYYRDGQYNKSLPEGHVYAPHIEHCIESLRLYVMCKGDATIQTFDWIDGRPTPQANYTAMEHQCVDWPRLQNWAIDHSFDLGPETISHPRFGYPYGTN